MIKNTEDAAEKIASQSAEHGGVKIDWFDVRGVQGEGLLLDAMDEAKAREIKVKLLARIGVVVAEGEKPMHAWMKHVHATNGVEYRQPAQKKIADAMMACPGAMSFLFFLA